MFSKVIQSVKNIIGKENFEFVLHARNYLSAQFFLKALSFISIPVFTRILLPDEYGLLSVYASIISIFTIIMGLNTRGAVTRFYHENKVEFADFLGNNIVFLFIYNVLFLSLVYLFRDYISSFFGVSAYLFMLAVLVSALYVPMNIFFSYLQTSKQSKRYSIISIIRSSAILVLSITLMLIISEKTYFGRVYAELIVVSVTLCFALYHLYRIAKFRFDFKYIRYGLGFGVPLIPHALSSFILSYFDRIIINQLTGAANTGLYSFAYNVGIIMNVVVMAMNKSWIPIFYNNLEKREYTVINNMAYNYSKYIYFAAIGLIFFSREIVLIIADKRYYSALSLVPVIIISFVFVFLYTLYGNYSFFRKRTGLISIMTLFAGFFNIGLNYLYIPVYGYSAAAYTTLISYFLLFVFHYLNVRYVLKEEYLIPLKKILPDLLFTLVVIILYIAMITYIKSYAILLPAKVIILVIVGWYFFVNKYFRDNSGVN